MRNKYKFSILIFAVVIFTALITGYAQESSASENIQSILAPDLHTQTPQAVSYGHKAFNVHVWNNNDKARSSVVNYSTASYSGQMGFMQIIAGFTHYLFSFIPITAGDKNSHSHSAFMVASLNNLLSPSLAIFKNIGNSEQLSVVLKASPAFEISENIRLKPDASASDNRNDEEKTATGRYSDPSLKPFIHNPYHNSSISISLPIAVTQSVTIAPAITYSFSTNNTNRQEYRGKSLINGIDKDSAIVYGGVHLKYTF